MKQPRVAVPAELASPGGKEGFSLPLSVPPALLFSFLATSYLQKYPEHQNQTKTIALAWQSLSYCFPDKQPSG